MDIYIYDHEIDIAVFSVEKIQFVITEYGKRIMHMNNVMRGAKIIIHSPPD